jgi:pyruvate dehydrogenase E2 component (dihydrolipoamide acetyltransferase)
MPEFRLPDLGEGLTDAELVSWRVAVGDTVALNDIVAEVETAKAMVELPSPFVGVVTDLLVAPGQTVPVGTPLIRIGAPQSPATEPAELRGTGETVLVGYGPGEDAGVRRRRPLTTRHVIAGTGRPDAKPAARKLARDIGVDLTAVTGTGPGGVITTSDVRAAGNATAETATAQQVPTQGETRVQATGVRKRTAEAMALSARTVPTATEFLTVDASASLRLLDELRGTPQFADLKLTPLTLVAKIVLVALADHPELNSHWDDRTDEIVTKHYVNLGIAVAAPRGLLVPNIKAAQQLTLRDLCLEINSLTKVARRGDAAPADLTGGTFTITNVGVFGVDTGTPMVNPGEAAILCLGAIAKRPWVTEDDRVEPRMVTTLGLSFDHRLIDGEQGSMFLADIGELLRNPLTLLSRL